MKKVQILSTAVHVEMDYWLRESKLKGTVESGWDEVRTKFVGESNEEEATLLEVMQLAKSGCHPENLVKTAVPLHSRVTLNGKYVELRNE